MIIWRKGTPNPAMPAYRPSWMGRGRQPQHPNEEAILRELVIRAAIENAREKRELYLAAKTDPKTLEQHPLLE